MLSCLLKQILFQHNTACFFTAFKLSRNIFQLVSNHGVRNKGNCVIIDWVTKKIHDFSNAKKLAKYRISGKNTHLAFLQITNFFIDDSKNPFKGVQGLRRGRNLNFCRGRGHSSTATNNIHVFPKISSTLLVCIRNINDLNEKPKSNRRGRSKNIKEIKHKIRFLTLDVFFVKYCSKTQKNIFRIFFPVVIFDLFTDRRHIAYASRTIKDLLQISPNHGGILMYIHIHCNCMNSRGVSRQELQMNFIF